MLSSILLKGLVSALLSILGGETGRLSALPIDFSKIFFAAEWFEQVEGEDLAVTVDGLTTNFLSFCNSFKLVFNSEFSKVKLSIYSATIKLIISKKSLLLAILSFCSDTVPSTELILSNKSFSVD